MSARSGFASFPGHTFLDEGRRTDEWLEDVDRRLRHGELLRPAEPDVDLTGLRIAGKDGAPGGIAPRLPVDTLQSARDSLVLRCELGERAYRALMRGL